MQKRRRNNYLHLNIKLAFHQKNSFGKRLKFRRDFIIYRKKKTKKIKIYKIRVEEGVSHRNVLASFSVWKGNVGEWHKSFV